jgi:hypothetical protein
MTPNQACVLFVTLGLIAEAAVPLALHAAEHFGGEREKR